MIENIEITAGVLIVALSWICGTIMSIVSYRYRQWSNERTDYLIYPLIITLLYGLFRLYNIFLK